MSAQSKVESIYSSALGYSGVERDAYLAGACGGDIELKQRVNQLLAAQEKLGSFLEPAASRPAATEDFPVDYPEGTSIGPYKLLQVIGEGGMGVVFMAEQKKPVQRRVALKIMKPDLDSRQVVARFEAERQALAMMDHPNIAHVFDVGSHEQRPYIVMELVKGVPINQYCDEQQLSTRERLALLVPVCHAVQHAHQKGVVHRDLKPSNVLIAEYDHEPVPKVIDFGVAKAIGQQLTEKTMFTRFGQIVGTLEYMSPEQAKLNQLDIDTRSDVYSLGVLMYELIAGTTPFDQERFRVAAFDEVLRIIREEEPPRPSIRVSTMETRAEVAANRRMEPNQLGKQMRGELDWIAMKALEKDRERRYQTANGLADDIRRYIENEPVMACPPSLAYRAKKLWQRNSQLVVTAAVVFVAMVVGLIGTTTGWLAYREKHQLALAQRDQIMKQKVDLETTQQNLTAQLLVNIQRAKPNQLAVSVDNVRSITEIAIPRLIKVVNDSAASIGSRTNAALALAQLGRSADVAEFLLMHVDEIDPSFSIDFIQVMRNAPRISGKIEALAAAAESSRDFERWSRLAIVALYLDHCEPARDMLRYRADNMLRAHFLRTFSYWHGPIDALASKVAEDEDVAFRTGIIQAVGVVPRQNDFESQTRPWLPHLTRWCASANDPATRSSAEWLLRKWELDVPALAPATESDKRGWSKGPDDLIMVHLPAGEFTMGTIGITQRTQRVRLTHPFMISDREVSIRLLEEFAEAHSISSFNLASDLDQSRAAHGSGWHDTRRFLNWLSKREGLEACYVEQRDAVGGIDFRLRQDADGYRLPTEAEWEYACRAGTITRYAYGPGSAESLYAAPNFRRLTCLPNSWGLFDMHGEAGEVVEDWSLNRPPVFLTWGIVEPFVNPFVGALQGKNVNVVVRGSDFCSSSHRDKASVNEWNARMAIRIARNLSNELIAVQLPTIESERESLERLAELSRGDCAPHLLEIARLQVVEDDVDGAALSVDAILDQIPPYEDYSSARSLFLTRLAEHEDVYNALVNRRPDDSHLRICRGRYYAFHEMWAEAAREFKSVIDDRDPRKSRWQEKIGDQERHEYAALLLHASMNDEYRAFRKKLMRWAEEYPTDLGPVWTMLKASTLAPIEDPETKQKLRAWLERIEKTGWMDQSPPPGLAAFRTGQYGAVLKFWGNRQGPRYGPVTAMVHWREGRKEQARALLASQRRTRMHGLTYGWPAYFAYVDDCLSHNLFLAEAEQEIYGEEENRLKDVARKLESRQ